MFNLLPSVKPSSVLMTICLFSVSIAGILLLRNSLPARTPEIAATPSLPPLPRVPPPGLLFDVKEIAGHYYSGEGGGINCTLEIQSNHHFRFQRAGVDCVFDIDSGLWELQGDVLVCKPDRPDKPERWANMNLRFLPVKWGKRYYLVVENGMSGFCAAAAGGVPSILEPHGEDYIKYEGDKLPPVQGAPLLPERYRLFYTKGAIKAHIVSIDSTGRLTLDKGSMDRLEPGMLLAVDAFENGEVKIVSVSEHAAVAEARYFWNSDRRLKIGERLTSGSFWHRPHGTRFKVYHDPPKLPEKK